jgi:steroid 5-alpha reductase family enzyme
LARALTLETTNYFQHPAIVAIGPAMLTYLIIGPMGAGLLEKRLGTNPAFDTYVRRTSAIVLWPPSK